MAEGAAHLEHVGALVERDVDGLWFTARVLSVNETDRSYNLLYLDDGNTEVDVPLMETRPVQDPESLPKEPLRARVLPTPPIFLPFQQLLATDEDTSKDCTPRIIVHAPGPVDEEGEFMLLTLL